MAWNTIAAAVLDDKFGYQGHNRIRDNLIALASRRGTYSFGGTRQGAPNFATFDPSTLRLRSKYPGLGPHNVDGWIDVAIDGTNLSGLTAQARVDVRTDNPAVTITPRILNVTDSTVAGTGVACSAGRVDYGGTNQQQTITLTLAAGVKLYRLQFTLGANALIADTWCIGVAEIFATA